MCGIVGFWTQGGAANPLHTVRQMANRLTHRGPDSSGEWCDGEVGIALAHRRLAIIDLSSAGRQPMSSSNGRYVISYNGEIYNHRELRSELESVSSGGSWAGSSDTETLLAAVVHWGLEGALKRLNGMFAFALWDRAERCLYLARDRLGEKPLYYGRCGGSFLFGSELKALRRHPEWRGEVDRGSLTSFFRYGYVPGPQSIYEGVNKLPAAHYLRIEASGTAISEPICYWAADAVFSRGRSERPNDPVEAVEELSMLLRDSVSMRMASDVPLGAFLSGGVDSSTIVALMQENSPRKIKTFSIGFTEEAYNEADSAKQVAEILGTDHRELYVNPSEAMAVIPHLPHIWDEPFADVSQIPTYLVSRLAREDVTVSLSGDGGDELFYGYTRYESARRMWNGVRAIPRPIRGAVGELAATAGELTRYFPAGAILLDRVAKSKELIASSSEEEFYVNFVSHFKHPGHVVIGGAEPPVQYPRRCLAGHGSTMSDRMMYADAMTYLPDDILVKVDRASMAVGLESRVPLLDHRIVEFAWALPLSVKFAGGVAKWPLKQVLQRYVPSQVWNRPKRGFGVPIGQWLRGPLRDWAEDLLDEQRIEKDGFLNSAHIRKMWEDHLSGRRRWHYCLWDVLMFQAWRSSEAQ